MPDEEARHVISRQVKLLVRSTLGVYLVLAGVIIGGLVFVISSQNRTNRLTAANHAAVIAQRHALTEVCRQSGVLRGIIEARADVDLFDLTHGLVPKAALPLTISTLIVFRRYQDALTERPACGEILNP